MTSAQIQQTILEQTGIKTSVKKLTGSMKQYTRFSPMFQGGEYPKFTVDFFREFPKSIDARNFGSCYSIEILNIHIEEGDPTKFKKERKPKSAEEMKVRTWGSANSQMRLDKRAAANAKKMRNGNTARYW